MNRGVFLILFLCIGLTVFGQNEIGPEGGKLLWIFLILGFVVFTVLLILRKKVVKLKGPLFPGKKVKIELNKDRLYYPDFLTILVKNIGNTDIDLDKPLLILDNFWLKRKFRLKGMDNRTFYPLYLEKGKTHSLQIDLSRFYSHDKSLKKFPKAKVVLYDIKGKKLGTKHVYLRKTLVKF